jgi:hypothetical protein
VEDIRCVSALASGLFSGPMIFRCSMTEPGHPYVTIMGSACSSLQTNVNELNGEAYAIVEGLTAVVEISTRGLSCRLVVLPAAEMFGTSS